MRRRTQLWLGGTSYRHNQSPFISGLLPFSFVDSIKSPCLISSILSMHVLSMATNWSLKTSSLIRRLVSSVPHLTPLHRHQPSISRIALWLPGSYICRWMAPIDLIFPKIAPAIMLACRTLSVTGMFEESSSRPGQRASRLPWSVYYQRDTIRPVPAITLAGKYTCFYTTLKKRVKDDHILQNLTFLRLSKSRDPFDVSESLSAHCERPFFAHNRMGVHLPDFVHAFGTKSESDRVLDTYGACNLVNPDDISQHTSPGSILSHFRMITITPERPGALHTINQLSPAGIIMSLAIPQQITNSPGFALTLVRRWSHIFIIRWMVIIIVNPDHSGYWMKQQMWIRKMRLESWNKPWTQIRGGWLRVLHIVIQWKICVLLAYIKTSKTTAISFRIDIPPLSLLGKRLIADRIFIRSLDTSSALKNVLVTRVIRVIPHHCMLRERFPTGLDDRLLEARFGKAAMLATTAIHRQLVGSVARRAVFAFWSVSDAKVEWA